MKAFLYVAIHTESANQVYEEIRKAYRAHADGVILVNNGLKLPGTSLFFLAKQAKNELSEPFLVGVNPLDMPLAEALRQAGFYAHTLDALWHDQCLVSETDGSPPTIPEEINAQLRKVGNVQIFGSVGLKGQPALRNTTAVTDIVSRRANVVVISGSATGVPPAVEKARAFADILALRGTPLAIASGVTKENVKSFLPYAQMFIVGSAFKADPRNEFVYDEEKIKAFKEEIAGS